MAAQAVYLYRFPSRPDGGAGASTAWPGPMYLLRTMRSRSILGGEVQVHVMGEPKGPHDISLPMFAAHIAAVLKYRLP